MPAINMIYDLDVDLDYLAKVVFVMFLYCKFSPSSPFPLRALWKEVTKLILHVRIRE